MNNLMKSIYDRWNNAGLNGSIAVLYSGGPYRKAGSNPFGPPEGAVLPRAQYYVSVPPAGTKSRGSRVHQALCTIEIWDDSDADLGADVNAIYNAFLNAEEAGTSPVSMTDGHVLEVEPESMFVEKVDDNVWRGTVNLTIRYSVTNAVPA